VRVGDVVKAGQVVAEIDPRPSQEELRVAQAAAAAAAAAHRQALVDIEDARRRFNVETTAAAAGVSPATNVEEARLAVKRAEAVAERALANAQAEKARLITAQSHLESMRLLAPFAGRVAVRYFDGGATLSAGQTVLRLISGEPLRLRFALEPEQTPRLPIGTEVMADIDSISVPVLAVVQQVSPALDPASGLVFLEASLRPAPLEQALLKPGLAATVRLPATP
jgi:multidrug efflux pump subunit AcrA (membrane-fusion protein)